MEYEYVLRHVLRRWLSLFKALERVLSPWPAIKQYFIQKGEVAGCKENGEDI
jgi:hypothetical protein